MVKGLVSVVIPTYNRSETIERAVDSVLDQGYKSVEVIIVDDGSKDNTAERILNRYSQDSRVRYFQFPNGGVCVARNRGLREVQGEFVAMLDSDDYWLPGKLSLQIGILEKHPELSMVWSDMDAIDTTGQIVSRRYLRTMYGSYSYFPSPLDLFETEHKTDNGVPYYIGHIADAMVIGNLVHTSTVVARADCLAKAGEYDQTVHPSEDQDYYYRVCLTGPVALIDVVTIHYQIGAADAASGDARYFELATSSMAVFKRLKPRINNDLLITKEIIRNKALQLHKWVGIASLHKGKRVEARGHLFKLLKHTPLDVQTLILFLMACIPYSLEIVRLLKRLRILIPKLTVPTYLLADLDLAEISMIVPFIL